MVLGVASAVLLASLVIGLPSDDDSDHDDPQGREILTPARR
ncbi:hypothetical protein [Nocardioides sp. T2.26MG-1]|nr:hypothetical protein [Nocardioides sp. T2.26MG-1]